MGWTGSSAWRSKQDVVNDLIKSETGLNILAHSVRGNTLWMVGETVKDTPHFKAGHRLILCVLLCSHQGEWSYKDMDESMGPNDVSCPLGYLDMVPDPGGYATAWRQRVRAAANAKADQRKLTKTLKVGDIVVLKAGCTPAKVKVLKAKPLVGEFDGRIFKVAPRHIDHVEPGEP